MKFLVVGAGGLFLGTVQGVYQVLPWSVDWLHRAGEAGRLIDPAAHAHINLVGGVAMAIAGFVYYFLPRVTGRPIYSRRLADASFYIAAVGVLAFWLGLIVLAFVEGNMIIDQGIDFQEAKDRVRVEGTRAKPRTDTYKVIVGYADGFIGAGPKGHPDPSALGSVFDGVRNKIFQHLFDHLLVAFNVGQILRNGHLEGDPLFGCLFLEGLVDPVRNHFEVYGSVFQTPLFTLTLCQGHEFVDHHEHIPNPLINPG